MGNRKLDLIQVSCTLFLFLNMTFFVSTYKELSKTYMQAFAEGMKANKSNQRWKVYAISICPYCSIISIKKLAAGNPPKFNTHKKSANSFCEGFWF